MSNTLAEGLLPDLNGVDLGMSLSPKSTLIHRHQAATDQENTPNSDALSVVQPDQTSSLQQQQQHLDDQQQHLLQDHHAHYHHLQQQQQHPHHHHHQHLLHSTPFSVTDILSPEESYRKLELANPPSPYR